MSDKQYSRSDLYIYDLADSVLESLKLVSFDDNLREVAPSFEAKHINEKSNQNRRLEPSEICLKCRACNFACSSQEIKRQHYKTDLHRFNVKRSLNGLQEVNEDEFNALLKNSKKSDDDSADSESDFSDDEELAEVKGDHQGSNDEIYRVKGDYLGNLIEQELEKLSLRDNVRENPTTSISHLNTRSAQIFFNSDMLPDSEAFCAYKTLFTKETINDPLDAIRTWNKIQDQSMEISALFMIGGGHFAGAIVSHQRANVRGNAKKQDENLQEQAVVFLEHKTFHRYTTRRKQGGSQSAMDQSKGKANSAGSSLRRYNETALKNDVQNILKAWSPYLGKCKDIYLRANSAAERKIFTENALVTTLREKLKNYPFTTGRPTVTELKRSWCELTYLKKSLKPTPLPPKRISTSKAENNTKSIGKKIEDKIAKSSEEVHTEELLSLLKKGRAPLLIAYMRKNNLNANFRLMPEGQYQSCPTMLHFASQHSLKQMVTILLTTMKCDPCIKNRMGKTAWDLAKNDQVKYAFQIARFKLGEDFTNWNESHVGEPLSRVQVDEIRTQESTRRNNDIEEAVKQEIERVKEKMKEKQRAEAGVRIGSGRILDSNMSIPSQNLNSLSPEQRRRLMREQRARAAESRMQHK